MKHATKFLRALKHIKYKDPDWYSISPAVRTLSGYFQYETIERIKHGTESHLWCKWTSKQKFYVHWTVNPYMPMHANDARHLFSSCSRVIFLGPTRPAADYTENEWKYWPRFNFRPQQFLIHHSTSPNGPRGRRQHSGMCPPNLERFAPTVFKTEFFLIASVYIYDQYWSISRLHFCLGYFLFTIKRWDIW